MAEETRERVLSIRDLEISFDTSNGTMNAIRGVRLDLYKGETIAIVGESGSGKSVTAKAIMGIMAKNQHINGGSIMYSYTDDEGRKETLDITKMSEDEVRKTICGKHIAMVFQDPMTSLNPTIMIGKQIMEGMVDHYHYSKEEARKKAQEEGKTYTTADLGNISFKWPCPASSRITSQFGDRESPTEGASSNHKGIDIGAASGSDILAAASGTVVIATYSYSAGNYIMIDHGGGVSTVYMHCSQLLAAEGDEVSQGQVIAKVGSTGYSTGPHLHFGIRSDGSYVNPLNYVSP